MKRMILILAVAVLTLGCLTACAGNNDDNGKI